MSSDTQSRSEGFPRTGYLLPARGTPGVSPDGESCWDAAVAAVSHLEIQVDILAGKLYLEFVPMELGPGGSSGRFETGVLQRISIPFIWTEWFGLGSHFRKIQNIKNIHFFKHMHVQKK